MKDQDNPPKGSGSQFKGQSLGQRWATFRGGLPLFVADSGFSVAAEQYRVLALQIEEAAKSKASGGLVVAVTAPNAGAGKTTTSLNLALALARKGEVRVLAIECDFWKPEYENMLAVSKTPIGLIDLLRDESRIIVNQSVTSIWGAGLDLIIGASTPGDGNLVTSRRMAELISDAQKSYDFVILDSPPFALASGKALARLADRILVVVGAKTTTSKGIEEMLSAVGLEKVVGMVLNRAKGVHDEYSKYSASYYYRTAGATDDPKAKAKSLERGVPRKQRTE